MNLNWRHWAYGLASAVIGGSANAVSVWIVDPKDFNLQEGLGKLATVALVSAVVNLAAYLKQHPLPPSE